MDQVFTSDIAKLFSNVVSLAEKAVSMLS